MAFSVEFKCQRNKQYLLLHILLYCTKLNLKDVADLLNVSYSLLSEVYKQQKYLTKEQGLRLTNFFILLFID